MPQVVKMQHVCAVASHWLPVAIVGRQLYQLVDMQSQSDAGVHQSLAEAPSIAVLVRACCVVGVFGSFHEAAMLLPQRDLAMIATPITDDSQLKGHDCFARRGKLVLQAAMPHLRAWGAFSQSALEVGHRGSNQHLIMATQTQSAHKGRRRHLFSNLRAQRWVLLVNSNKKKETQWLTHVTRLGRRSVQKGQDATHAPPSKARSNTGCRYVQTVNQCRLRPPQRERLCMLWKLIIKHTQLSTFATHQAFATSGCRAACIGMLLACVED